MAKATPEHKPATAASEPDIPLASESSCFEIIDNLLNEPRQMWLLGAGVSLNAGIPLMYPLTERVEAMLSGTNLADYKSIRSELNKDIHVEHVLSHIGDLIAITGRMRSGKGKIGTEERSVEELEKLHTAVQDAIRRTIQWGYKPKSASQPTEKIGTASDPIVQVDDHVGFITSIFQHRRAGLDRRPPVAFFTVNYDTLIEDALALCRVSSVDGFCGGAMAFWNPEDESTSFDDPLAGNCGAKIYKLHGSIDWFMSREDIVVRRREWAAYPKQDSGKLLIYPQATKYQLTQKDPFARLMGAFRAGLGRQATLAVCGYSFGDDHINEDIERALRQRGNELTIVAFVSQRKEAGDNIGLPAALKKWLSEACAPWNKRIWVAGKYDIFNGSLKPVASADTGKEFQWWSFAGLTKFLCDGPASVVS